MAVRLVIHPEKIINPDQIEELCPFSAIEFDGMEYMITAACKMCRLCAKQGPPGAFEIIEESLAVVDKKEWRGIAIYADRSFDGIHPVTLELLGKAQELAAKSHQPIYCLLIGHGLESLAEKLRTYGADQVFFYDHPNLSSFRIEPYAAVFEDFIQKMKPAVVLVGGTPVGRSLAPRLAARFRTGLTADCTQLDMQAETDLIQIRPAFGGNIMARIVTPQHRPQFATVRYKVMTEAKPCPHASGKIVRLDVAESLLRSDIRVLKTVRKNRETDITDAEILVVAGRGISNLKDLAMLEELADLLNGQLASTRPLVEKGWLDVKKHVGLSGRTVKPKLMITCGVSGAIQFTAGVENSECIFSINKDPDAPIFQIANYGIVGDLYEIVPALNQALHSMRGSQA
jgi:electron transfer flavoprotein alpha subunit